MEDVGVPTLARAGHAPGDRGAIAAEARVRIGTFGHAGDGNLHPDLVFERGDPRAEAMTKLVQADLYRAALAARRNGHRRTRDRVARRDWLVDSAAPTPFASCGRSRRARSAGHPEPGPGASEANLIRAIRPAANACIVMPCVDARRIAPARRRLRPRLRCSSPACRPAPPRPHRPRRRPIPSAARTGRDGIAARAVRADASRRPQAEIDRLLRGRHRRPRRSRSAAGPRLRLPPAGPGDGGPVAVRRSAEAAFDAAGALAPDDAAGPRRDRRPAARAGTSSPTRSRRARGRRARRRRSPRRGRSMVDALVELGRYDEADAEAASEMLALRRVTWRPWPGSRTSPSCTAIWTWRARRACGSRPASRRPRPREHGVRRVPSRQPARLHR